MYERLELYIETLTGTAFELRVSPFETVQDIKARIQKLEGIPITQQHLIWQTVELEDDHCLSDYSIQDGATLKLVLTMRGGPINTRRIPMEDPSVREMAEYLTEANKDELMEKVSSNNNSSSNRPVTVIVYHNGDQFNFFRVVDREAASPLSESLSGASVYNLYDEEEEEEEEEEAGSPAEEKREENDKMREKMKLVRMKMENLTVNKKQVKKKVVPRPPSTGRPSSKTRLRRLPSHSAAHKSAKSLNRNRCLPPVGQSHLDGVTESQDPSNVQVARDLFQSATAAAAVATTADKVPVATTTSLGIRRLESVESNTKRQSNLSSVQEDNQELFEANGLRYNNKPESSSSSSSASRSSGKEDPSTIDCDNSSSGKGSDIGIPRAPTGPPSALSKETVLRRAHSSLRAASKWEFSPELLLKDTSSSKPLVSRAAESSSKVDTESSAPAPTTELKGLERLLAASDSDRPTAKPSHDGSSIKEHRLSSTSVRHSIERLHSGGVVLETLHPSEVRAMSGMLSSLVRSASKSRAGFSLTSGATSYKDSTRIPTPDGRLMSARLQRMSGSRDITSPTHRLPPVKQKKKSKRCFVCGKKTGLANSYPCRCSHNFCATHRYPEAHNCTFDYKTEGRKLLEQNNPVVTAPKLPKI